MPAPFRALALAIAVVAAPLTVTAQQAAGPTAAAANVGFRASTGDPTLKSAVDRASANNTQALDIALMVGGGAALLIGIIVGSTGGIILALVGAAIGIVGLILYLR